MNSPQLTAEAEKQRGGFSTQLYAEGSTTKTARMAREIECAPTETALCDNLHLTKANAKLMAVHIERVVRRAINKETPGPRTKVRYYEDPVETEVRQKRNEQSREGRCRRGDQCFFDMNKKTIQTQEKGIRAGKEEKETNNKEKEDTAKEMEKEETHTSKEREDTVKGKKKAMRTKVIEGTAETADV